MVYAYTQDVPVGPELYEKIIEGIGSEPVVQRLDVLDVLDARGALLPHEANR